MTATAGAKKIHGEVMKLLHMPLVKFQDRSVYRAVDGAVLIIKGVIDGTALPSKGSVGVSDFHRQVYDGLANLLTAKSSVLGSPGKCVHLCGPAAMEKLLADFGRKLASPKSGVDLNDCFVFRQFRWMLPIEWDTKISKLVADLRKRRAHLLEKKMICDGDSEDGELPKDAAAPEEPEKPKKRMATKGPSGGACASAECEAADAAEETSSSAKQPKATPKKIVKGDACSNAAMMALFFPKKMD